MPNVNADKCRLRAAVGAQAVRMSTELSALLPIDVVTSRLRGVVRRLVRAMPRQIHNWVRPDKLDWFE